MGQAQAGWTSVDETCWSVWASLTELYETHLLLLCPLIFFCNLTLPSPITTLCFMSYSKTLCLFLRRSKMWAYLRLWSYLGQWSHFFGWTSGVWYQAVGPSEAWYLASMGRAIVDPHHWSRWPSARTHRGRRAARTSHLHRAWSERNTLAGSNTSGCRQRLVTPMG